MGQIDILRDCEIVDSLLRNGPNLTKAAKELGTTSQALRTRIENTPALKAEFESAADGVVDLAIEALKERIAIGDIRAITFALENFGRHRGFGKQDTNTPKTQNNTQINYNLSELTPEEKLVLAKIAKQRNKDAMELASIGG